MPDEIDLTPLSNSEQPDQVSSLNSTEGESNNSTAEPVLEASNTVVQPTPQESTAASEALISLALQELRGRRDALQHEINSLNQRKSQLEKDIAGSFAGQSDAIARRVKGFQEYLSGALQGMAQSVEQLELVAQPVMVQPSPLDQQAAVEHEAESAEDQTPAIADTFRPDEALIRSNLERFLEQPDFYADPWKLRRSLDNSDTTLLKDWFFNQGGRGAQSSRGSRTRNVLVSSALIAILSDLYGDRFQTLVLAGQPERLGEWRRGLQDALGLGREDFGTNSGIVLFERGDALVERADRLEERGELPLIVIDAAERFVDIPVLQFPLWLAFAALPGETYEDDNELL